jgi:hypothetical protein
MRSSSVRHDLSTNTTFTCCAPCTASKEVCVCLVCVRLRACVRACVRGTWLLCPQLPIARLCSWVLNSTGTQAKDRPITIHVKTEETKKNPHKFAGQFAILLGAYIIVHN